jgi:light-regulated signal transduction histidine kinase (bacteriophytochrome)
VSTNIAHYRHEDNRLDEALHESELQIQAESPHLAKTITVLLFEIAERRRVEEGLRDNLEKFKIFAYSIIHDLRGPAMGICGLTQLLQKQYANVLDDRAKQYCDRILQASEHLSVLVEQVNSYIASKELPLKIDKIDIEEILQAIRAEFSALLDSRQIRWLKPESIPAIKADKMAILRVFRNLIDNSLKYGGEGLSEIEIGYRESREHHIFSVRDDGVGIKREHSKKIFEMFERINTSINLAGTGLGLAIVKEIATRHGGKVWIEASGERGTTFCISISKRLKPGSETEIEAGVRGTASLD